MPASRISASAASTAFAGAGWVRTTTGTKPFSSTFAVFCAAAEMETPFRPRIVVIVPKAPALSTTLKRR